MEPFALLRANRGGRKPRQSASRSAPIVAGQRALGDAIRRARTSQGLTQIELAESLGMHRTQLGHVEQGKKDCQLSTLMRLADALGLPLSMLVRSAQL
ncbi:helix-turn-helix domain-containing protein [Stenotrophomonas sp. GZD-301]|uniref:helix-turn-helix domain-containing protein n=1 Tax=Stenotrophomonas sp. GZD-301 TaxID=3404814 RepID=UPI003BB51824